MKLNKLSFNNRGNWEAQRANLYPELEGNPTGTYSVNGDTIVEIGNIPKKPMFDEEGTNINAGLHNADFAVDIYSEGRVNLPKPFFVVESKDWYHQIAGASPSIEIDLPNNA